jgi:hypothetical protein
MECMSLKLTPVGSRVPFERQNPFFQTTPGAIDVQVAAFCLQLGGLQADFVPVLPAPTADSGMCLRNVEEHVARHGGRRALGWAIWENEICLMAEFHCVWVSPDGEVIDITPAEQGESQVVFAFDESYEAGFDWRRRPANRAMRAVDRTDPAAVSRVIGKLAPAQRAYEEKRAARKGMDLATHLSAKMPVSALAEAVDALIHRCGLRDRLVVPTTSGPYSPDPEAFMIVQSQIDDLQERILRLLVKRG